MTQTTVRVIDGNGHTRKPPVEVESFARECTPDEHQESARAFLRLESLGLGAFAEHLEAILDHIDERLMRLERLAPRAARLAEIDDDEYGAGMQWYGLHSDPQGPGHWPCTEGHHPGCFRFHMLGARRDDD